MTIEVRPVLSRTDRRAFLAVPPALRSGDPHWVRPLSTEAAELIDPAKNPFFDHATVDLFVAWDGRHPVGRISAHTDDLALAQPAEQGFGSRTGFFGLFEAENDTVAKALLMRAEARLRERGMDRVLGPISLSVWEEPGLLTSGHDHSPTVMMGHDPALYREWIEGAGYGPAKQLYTYELDITQRFPPLITRVIESGRRNERIRTRMIDKSRFDEEAATILEILNDAWSDNWGFVPITDREIAVFGRKIKPLVFEELIRIAEYDGEPVAFMMTLPDLNEAIKPLNGSLFPFGWARLLYWLRKPRPRTMRVPLMGVVKRLQSSRLASQLSSMLFEEIRAASVDQFGATRGEVGWVLDDNQGMIAIAEAIESRVNRTYTIYEKALG